MSTWHSGDKLVVADLGRFQSIRMLKMSTREADLDLQVHCC